MKNVSDRPWEELSRLATAGEAEAVIAFLEELPAGEAGRVLSRMDADDQAHLFKVLPADEAASLMEQISDVQAGDLIDDLEPAEAAAIFQELRTSDQADLLAELEDHEAEAILAAMDPEDAGVVRALATYPPDVAGGIMVTELLSYPADAQVRDVVEDMRAKAEEYADYQVQYLYVTDADGRLVGVLRLRDLLLSRASTRLSELMIASPLSVLDDATLDELAAFFDRNHFLGVPVVDREGRLMGLARRADLAEGLVERTESDYRKTLGIVGGEELRTMPVVSRSLRRLSWLSVNIVLNVMAASVIALYEETLTAVIALAAFLPIVSDMSGCSGNQAVAVSIRELSLGLVKPSDVFRVWMKEISVGALNGLALGVLLGLVAFAWRGNPYLGLVVGAALAINTVVSVSIGGAVPLVLRRFDMDPALASGPILTTVTDMCGFLLTLGFAAAMLPHLI